MREEQFKHYRNNEPRYKRTEVDEMFDKAEALQNAARLTLGLKALPDQELELIYQWTKAERRERNKIPVRVAGMSAVAVYGDMSAENVKRLKNLAVTLTADMPDAKLKRMEVLESGAIRVTYVNDGEHVTKTYEKDSTLLDGVIEAVSLADKAVTAAKMVVSPDAQN